MVEKFDPAPLDKCAEDSKEAARADREMDGKLKAGLVGTFPASDPVSAVQPAPTVDHEKRRSPSFWEAIKTMFK